MSGEGGRVPKQTEENKVVLGTIGGTPVEPLLLVACLDSTGSLQTSQIN